MATSTSSSSSILVQDIFQHFHSRKLLINTPDFHQSASPTPSKQPSGASNFDANVVMILSVLLCALICSLGLNSIIRCALRCSRQSSSSPDLEVNNVTAAKLANTGIRKKALKTFPIINYSPDLKLPGLDTECAICLSDFASGERVRVLPKCNHGFHVRCIDKWLNSHSSCPTCRHCLIETCEKIVGCSSTQATIPGPSVQIPATLETIVVRIAPLEPETLIRAYQT